MNAGFRLAGVVALLAAAPGAGARAADDFSQDDKLRTLYSAEFRFGQDGAPVVPVAIGDNLAEVTLSAGKGQGLRLLPEGESGAQIDGEVAWRITARAATPAKLRHFAIVWTGTPAQSRAAQAQLAAWKKLGEAPRMFEHGTLFAVAGKVLDQRELLVAVGPFASFDEADHAHAALAKKVAPAPPAARGVYTELVDRPRGEIEAVGVKSGIRVRNEGVLWFAPTGELPTQVAARGQDKAFDVAGTYHGKLYVTFDRQGRLAVVNALSADRLLAGLVPAEIFPSSPPDALKAQAVAARGHLLSKIGRRHVGDPYRLCSRTHCQVYSGAGKEHPRTTAAVQATRGELLFKAEGHDLVDTVYSANCGGHTENNDKVWSSMAPAPELRGFFDGVDADARPPTPGASDAAARAFILNPPRTWDGVATIGVGERYRWKVTLLRADVDRLLAVHRLGVLTELKVSERGVSGRALSVKLTGDKGSATIAGELNIRRAFGNLRSSLFVADVKDGGVTFQGAGYGHGAGLCQTGSIGLAEAGKDYKFILQHYYRGSAVKKLW